jgi:membrane-associated HD superfamily phosphohydrolase
MVEAASRTVRNRAQLEDIVHGLIENSRADGQLDECDLTFRELAVVRESFIRTLSAVRHERIAYPGQPEEPARHEPDSDPERLRRIIEA